MNYIVENVVGTVSESRPVPAFVDEINQDPESIATKTILSTKEFYVKVMDFMDFKNDVSINGLDKAIEHFGRLYSFISL